MKILITSTCLPPIAGGAEQIAWETAKRIAMTKEAEVHLLTVGKLGTFKREGVIVHQVPKTPLLTLVYSTLRKSVIDCLLKNEKFDIIHAHIPLPWAFVLRNYSAKKIITFHGSETGLNRPKLKFLIEKRLMQKAISKFEQFTVPSKFFKKEIDRLYRINTQIIPNGVDTKKFRPLENVTQEKNVILFVGRYMELKGIRELLAVAKELPQYEFWFVGKGPLENEIKGKNIKNLGLKTSEELVKIYNQTTICVFPSHRENLPMVGLEASSCGKAIIATKLGFSEIIKNGEEGIIIDSKNKEQLKRNIERLMNNKEFRKKLEKNARKKALKYDLDEIVKKYLEVYTK